MIKLTILSFVASAMSFYFAIVKWVTGGDTVDFKAILMLFVVGVCFFMGSLTLLFSHLMNTLQGIQNQLAKIIPEEKKVS